MYFGQMSKNEWNSYKKDNLPTYELKHNNNHNVCQVGTQIHFLRFFLLKFRLIFNDAIYFGNVLHAFV